MTDKLSQPIALRILNSLKDGVPSIDDVNYFSSKSNQLDKRIDEYLKEIATGHYGKVIFLNGSYGEGKSHFLSRVRKLAIREGFLASMFQISPRGVSLDMMERAFAEIMKNLTVKNYDPEINEEPIEFMLSDWKGRVQDFQNALRKLPIDKDLKAALSEIAKRTENTDLYHDDLDLLYRWFRAESLSLTEMKRKFKIYNLINPRNVLDIFKSLSLFSKRIGYKGLVVLIDEQEIISTLLTTRKRELTDQNIRILIDEQSKMDGIFILFATTDEFFNDPVKGVVSYPALKTRISKANTLSLPAIGKAEMEEISRNIHKICMTAWNAKLQFSQDDISGCVKVAEDNNIPSARARTYVKSMVTLMESIRDGNNLQPTQQFENIYKNTFIEVATEREQFESGELMS